MTLVWLGILMLAFSWLGALPIFHPASGSWPWLPAGVALLVVGLRDTDLSAEGERVRPAVAVLVVSIAAAAWLAAPFHIGFLLLGLAAIVTLLPVVRTLGRWALPGLWVSGMVCVLQAACVPFLYAFCARYHRTAELPFLHDLLPGYPAVPWLAALLYVPIKILNPAAALNGSTLYLSTSLDTVALTPTWEKLGLIPAVLFAAGAGLVVLLRPDWRRRLAGLLVCIVVFLYVRLLFLFVLVMHVRNERVFWLPDALLFSFLPGSFFIIGKRQFIQAYCAVV